jgi:hypothetical protein
MVEENVSRNRRDFYRALKRQPVNLPIERRQILIFLRMSGRQGLQLTV